MKKLICLLFVVFCFSIQMMAQVKKATAKPVTPPMPDIDKMLKSLPADQRAAVKEMIGNATGSAVNKKEAVKKPASPIVKIQLKQPLQVPTEAQAKDHLLWYKGKKMNDSMIVTSKGMLVLYSQKRNMVIAQPLEKADPFGIMVKNVSKEAKMTEDYIEGEAAKKNSWMNYPLIQITVDEFSDKDEQLNTAIKNTIDLPEVASNKPAANKPNSGTAVSFTPKEKLKQVHNQLRQLLQNEPAINIEAPPKKRINLSYFCDEDEAKRYQQERRKWEDEFLEYEYNLMRTVISIHRLIALTGVDTANTEPGHSGLSADLEKAFKLAISRSDEKVKQLISRYGKDIFMQDCVIQTILKNERNKQLLGVETKAVKWDDVPQLIEGPEFENYMKEEIDKKNWDVILNLSVTLGRMRELTLIGGGEETLERLKKLVLRITHLNRFALTADLDFSMEIIEDNKIGYKATGEIQTSDKVYVCLAIMGCKWTLRQTEPDYGNNQEASYIPMKVTGGIKTMQNEKGVLEDFPYSGPKEMLMFFPDFRIDFADQSNQDTATIENIRYSLNANVVTTSINKAYTTDFLASMQTVFFISSKMEPTADKMMALANEMKGKFSALTSMPNSTTTLGRLKDQFLLMQQKQEAEKSVADLAFTAKAIILFNAQNNSSILIDNSVDTKHKDGSLDVTKGIIKIKVVHDPVPD